MGMDAGKSGVSPPLPRSRDRNETCDSHWEDIFWEGAGSRLKPEAGRPIHLL